MEGMILKEMVSLQKQYLTVNGSEMSLERWATGLVQKLLEITHGQWLYRNLVVHDGVSGTLANKRKEELLARIEEVQAMGGGELSEEEKFLSEVNLEDLEHSNGERQTYWLLAMETYARRRVRLRGAAATQENH